MNLDVELLSRIQFAVTVGFHFLFPPISIGLAWLLVLFEGIGWRKNDEGYVRIGKYFGKLLGITFAVGVATGVVMEFQFGTNWAQYSKFVGDIFGAPLAAEGVFAFFLESGFLGLYLFGRNKVSKGVHWFSVLMVAVGATISAFWIIVANSWQQTPAGYVVQNGRAELTNFADAIFNPSTMPRFYHTVDAALIAGAFFVAGVAAYLIRKNKEVTIAKKALKVAVVFGLIASLFEVFPFGDNHARQVAQTQPEKFAAMQGLYKTETGAPLVLFGIPSNEPPELKGKIGIPGLLSWLTTGDMNGTIKGMNEFPADNLPPIFLTFTSYHLMIALGMFFILLMAYSVWQVNSNKMWNKNWLLKLLTWSIPLPLLACQFGWIAAEVGRQPWIVYKLMKTRDAFSAVLTGEEVLFSLILFSIIYILIGSVYLFLLRRELNHGPEPSLDKEVLS